MAYSKLTEVVEKKQPYTALFYCSTGVGKTTTAGLIAEKSKGKTLILDVDRTIATSLGKGEIVKDISRIDIKQISNATKKQTKKQKKCLKNPDTLKQQGQKRMTVKI